MTNRRPTLLLFACMMAALGPAPRTALAQDGGAAVSKAREEFLLGAAFIRELQYADALGAFERSAQLRPHAVTTYNIGACFRALGKYTLARKTLEAALAQDSVAGGKELSDSLKAEARGFLAQIEQLLARVDVTLAPADATVTVDGAPLDRAQGDGTTLVAGTRRPGPGEPPPSARFSMIIDPGTHLFTMTRKGFADAVVNRAFLPGGATALTLELDKLPATLAFSSTVAGAAVSVGGVDVGTTPVDISRPAGLYHVTVKKPGFITYEADVEARPGERVDLRAALKEDKPALTQRWWFWTAAGVVVAGVAAGTYFATRPEPERPPLSGGGLGWTLQAQ